MRRIVLFFAILLPLLNACVTLTTEEKAKLDTAEKLGSPMLIEAKDAKTLINRAEDLLYFFADAPLLSKTEHVIETEQPKGNLAFGYRVEVNKIEEGKFNVSIKYFFNEFKEEWKVKKNVKYFMYYLKNGELPVYIRERIYTQNQNGKVKFSPNGIR